MKVTNNIYDESKLKVIHEAGIRGGIRFAVSIFLGNLPSSIQEEMHPKTVDYLIQEYYKRIKSVDGLRNEVEGIINEIGYMANE